MTDLLITVFFMLFAGWVGYNLGLEDSNAEFQEKCVQLGLYETKTLSIRCDVISQTINGKVFYINK